MVFVKIIGRNHGNYPYKLGLNTLEDSDETSDPSSTCGPGGLYYTDIEYVFRYLEYGTTVCIVHPAEDARVVDLGTKYKTDKLVIEEMMPLWEVDTILYLLEHGADVHVAGDLALRTSAQSGYTDVVRVLLEHGANVHAGYDLALLWSVERDHVEVVRLLLEHGANVHVQTDYALRYAVEHGHVEVVKLLLEHGASVHVMYSDDGTSLCIQVSDAISSILDEYRCKVNL